jgi:phosphoribosyl-ATP pyrophosphohydrolase
MKGVIYMKNIFYLRNLKKCTDKNIWSQVCAIRKLPENFIRKYADRVNWINISLCQKLSEDFIREFADKVYWHAISCNQKLSEDFIREFADKVYWFQISIHQELSDEFIEEFKDRLQSNRINISKFKMSLNEYIKSTICYVPCQAGLKKYLKIWNKNTKITWNEFIQKYPDKTDIEWVYNVFNVINK